VGVLAWKVLVLVEVVGLLAEGVLVAEVAGAADLPDLNSHPSGVLAWKVLVLVEVVGLPAEGVLVSEVAEAEVAEAAYLSGLLVGEG